MQILGFKICTPVSISFDGTFLKSVNVPGNTVIKTTITIPSSASPGQRTVSASGTSQNGTKVTVSRSITMVKSEAAAKNVPTPKAADVTPTNNDLAVGVLGGAA